MDSPLNQTASETIELLEARLRRIEYIVSSHFENAANHDSRSAYTRLTDLEHTLDQLVAKSRVMQDLLKLYTRHPDLFHVLTTAAVPTSLDVESKLSVVLASASSYPLTASRLTSIHDTPLPNAEASAQLVETRGQTARIDIRQELQLREIAELKQRSTAVIQRWYAINILNTGECWADVQSRVEQTERLIHREALARQRDDCTLERPLQLNTM